jgi:hypothetical protein
MSKSSKAKSKTLTNAPDLTTRPPRSPRARLGGYAVLPRVLDKGRATIVGKNGEYNFNCPLDRRFFRFIGIDADALKVELGKGKGDGEILEWIESHSKTKPQPWEVTQWSAWMDQRGPDSDAETISYFAEAVNKLTKTREDIRSWSDLLDLDDYVSFGGKA